MARTLDSLDGTTWLDGTAKKAAPKADQKSGMKRTKAALVMQVQISMALINSIVYNILTDGTDSHLTALTAWQKSGIKSGPKKRHQAELVMQAQIPMALIDNIVKNMSMTLYDRRL